jgi:heterodisulfide reductase subunit B
MMETLEIDLVDLENATCCAPIPIESLDYLTSLALSAYNICLAEEADLNLMAICNGCYQSLSISNKTLQKRKELKNRVNAILAKVGREYTGSIEVKDYLQVLCEDVGLETLRQSIVKPFHGLKTAVFYGCHLLKPSSLLSFDNPENPRLLDELVELTGATSVPYMYKNVCCGGLLKGVSDEIANQMARDKLFNASQVNADCIITVCPFCFLQLDLGQLVIKRKYSESFDIPVIHYPELIDLAFGIDPKELGLHTHRVSTTKILSEVG